MTLRPDDGTPDAARRLRARLPRLLRIAAADDVPWRARQRRLRLREHRAARPPGPPARLPGRLLRPAGPHVPARAVRRVQGDPHEDAGRPARPVPQGPRSGQGVAHPRLRDARVRGGRRHRHDHEEARAEREPRDDDRHGRSRHAPARYAAHPPHDHAVRRREHGHLRRRQDRRTVRPSARPDDRLQGAQGRPDRQHPGRPRRGREDRGEAHPRVRQPGRDVRPHRRGHAGEAARQAARALRPDPDGPRAVDHRPRPTGRAGPRSGPPRRLRPRHGRPPLPRVRIPHADRAPPADGRRIGRAAVGEPQVRGRQRVRARGPRRRSPRRLGTRADDGTPAEQ